ncbi:unnamed protein product, partial [Gulo gulo]
VFLLLAPAGRGRGASVSSLLRREAKQERVCARARVPSRPLRAAPTPGTPGPGQPSYCYDNQFCEDTETGIVSVRWAGRGRADSPHSRSQNFRIMRKKENASLSSTLKETKEARRAPGTEDPSFNSCAGSSTSVHSFTDDLGYQGSRELSSETGWWRDLAACGLEAALSGAAVADPQLARI